MIRPSDPPPIREEWGVAYCRSCQTDTWHFLQIGQHGATKDCGDCGEISDYEGAA